MSSVLPRSGSLELDLRAEVLSRPTPEMWDAMRDAEIGWYGLQQDESVAELEAVIAEKAGKEAGFYVATGALANLIAVMCLAERGTQVVMERRCHIYWHEENGAPFLMGLATRLVDGGRLGKIDPSELASVLDERYGYGQTTSLVCLENTHSIAGGTIVTPAETAELVATARRHGAQAIYLDGARLWNAAVAAGAPVSDFLEDIDAAMLSMNKGLGGPVGAVLVGSRAFVASARRQAQRLGVHSMHRIGLFAAAALVGLRTLEERLRGDHRRALALAEGLACIEGLSVDLETVQTNIVRVAVARPGFDGSGFVSALAERGVGARVIEPPDVVKFNLYSEISDENVEQVLEAARAVMTGASRAESWGTV